MYGQAQNRCSPVVRAKAPAEDPSLKAAREREEARAESAFVTQTQSVLDDETRRRTRRLGRRAALSGVSPGGGNATVGGGSFIPLSSYSGGGSFFGGGAGGDMGSYESQRIVA